MGAFSSKSAPAASPAGEISDVDRAMLDLKNARDRLQKYRKKLEQDDAKLLAQAKKAKEAGQKDKALGILRLRKYKKAQASSCEDQLLNVMQMVETIDSKQNERQVLDAMAAGKDTLKKMHEETTVDDVLDLMDSIKEEVEVEQEITTILQGVPELSPADELAVEAELEALQAELAASTTDTTLLPELPTVPNSKLPEVKEPTATTATAAQPVERIAVPG
mmetsp:Transcript_29012/g.79601  ORF Transcript_29012/g.79601 Transcript_29012/m.79601 type:complete len:220 (-) Transcript_29012:155-814(-)